MMRLTWRLGFMGEVRAYKETDEEAAALSLALDALGHGPVAAEAVDDDAAV